MEVILSQFIPQFSLGGKIGFLINTLPKKAGHIIYKVFCNIIYKIVCFKSNYFVISDINHFLQVYGNEIKFCSIALYAGAVEGHL
jgi:hypothetical protein